MHALDIGSKKLFVAVAEAVGVDARPATAEMRASTLRQRCTMVRVRLKVMPDALAQDIARHNELGSE